MQQRPAYVLAPDVHDERHPPGLERFDVREILITGPSAENTRRPSGLARVAYGG